MPNDMSPLEVPLHPDTGTRLARRTAKYCERAYALQLDPCLTQDAAVMALDHLAQLQNDLAAESLRESRQSRDALRRVEDHFKPLEARLKQARSGLSSALLRAKVVDSNLYALVPHAPAPPAQGPDETDRPDDVIGNQKDTTPASKPAPPAVSASRALLDLEALRPYLSEHALRQAIEKHDKDTGTHTLNGVAYATLPPSAHLPCEIY